MRIHLFSVGRARLTCLENLKEERGPCGALPSGPPSAMMCCKCFDVEELALEVITHLRLRSSLTLSNKDSNLSFDQPFLVK